MVLAVVFSLVAAAARAQGPYVAATIGADVERVGHTTSQLSTTRSGDSEVASWSLRAGTGIGDNWGVELEFVQSLESRGEIPLLITPLDVSLTNLGTGAFLPDGLSSRSVLPGIPIPIGGYQTDVRQRHTDVDTVAWVRQRAGGSVDLVYLGGIAFSRQRAEITQTFPTLLALFAPGGGTFRSTAVSYSTRPLVGAEARIGLTSHIRLIPGVRLQGIAGGWLVRPYAGLGWFF